MKPPISEAGGRETCTTFASIIRVLILGLILFLLTLPHSTRAHNVKGKISIATLLAISPGG